MSNQNIFESIQDRMDRGLISSADANVELILAERFRVIRRLTREVRSALNCAVKKGILGHIKKEGLKPEVYYNPTFEYLAKTARNKEETACLNSLKGIYA